MNESLSLTGQGIAAYRQSENPAAKTRPESVSIDSFYSRDLPLEPTAGTKTADLREAEKWFREAAARYPDNAFADLWLAVIESEQGDLARSNQRFSAFLEKKNAYDAFEKAVLTPREFETLQSLVRSLLKARGVSVPEAREVGVLSRWLRNFGELEPVDQKVNVLFSVVLLLGTIGLSLAYFTGNLYPKGWPRFLTGVYFSCGAGFGFWITDLAVGLPFKLSRFRLVPWFLFISSLLLLGREGWSYWKERYSPVEKGYSRCRRCGRIFPVLMLECPDCRQRKNAGN